MTTRINQRQVGSKTATHLGDQLTALDTKINDIQNRAGFIKGSVDTEQQLPAGGNATGDVWLVKSTNSLLQWNEQAGWVDLGAKPDPVLDGRLASLESLAMTVGNTYTENFTSPIVDTVNSDAIVGQGYVKPGKNFYFEAFDNTNNTDTVNSSAYKIAGGKLTLANAITGKHYSKQYTTAGTDSAIINVVENQATTDALIQTNSIVSATALPSVSVDKFGRMWYFSIDSLASAKAYVKIINADGTTALNNTQIGSTLWYGYGSVSGVVTSAGNKAWVTVGSTTAPYTPQCMGIDDTGAVIVQPFAVPRYLTGSPTFATIWQGIRTSNGKVWGFFSETSASQGWISAYAVDDSGTLTYGPTVMPGYASGWIHHIWPYEDTNRNRVVLFGSFGNGTGYLHVAAFDTTGNGSLVKGWTNTGITTNGYSGYQTVSAGALFDAQADQFVAFVGMGATLRAVRLDAATLNVIDYKDYVDSSYNLCRINNVGRVTTTNNSTSSYLVDGSATTSSSSWMPSGVATGAAWATIDLGYAYPINRLKGYQGSPQQMSWTFALSLDGTNWTDVASCSLTTSGWADKTFPTVNARYIKVYKFSSTTLGWAVLTEVEAYQDPAYDNQVIDSLPVPTSTGPRQVGAFGIKRGNKYVIAYGSYKQNPSYTIINTAVIDAATLNVISKDSPVTGSTASDQTAPWWIDNPDGTARLRYVVQSNTNEAKYASVSTTTKYYLSNDGGTTWLQATPGQQLNFASRDSRLKVRVDMTSPLNSITPEILEYTVRQWNSATDTNVVSTFVSGKLPAVQAVNKATLTVNQTLNGGSIAWYMSNNGGASWFPVSLGDAYSFANAIGPDMRVKAVLQCDLKAANLPIITGYTIATTSMVSSTELQTVEINLMKTNFKLDSYTNAVKNNMKNLVIDVFSDISGIDAAKSTYTFDSTNKCVSGTTVQSKVDTASAAPNNILLIVDETLGTGTIGYQVSRDAGVTRSSIGPGALTSIANQPSGTSIVMKANFTGNAKLNAWAYSWS